MFLKEQKIKFMGIFKLGCNDGSIVKGAAYRSISVPPIPVKGAGALETYQQQPWRARPGTRAPAAILSILSHILSTKRPVIKNSTESTLINRINSRNIGMEQLYN